MNLRFFFASFRPMADPATQRVAGFPRLAGKLQRLGRLGIASPARGSGWFGAGSSAFEFFLDTKQLRRFSQFFFFWTFGCCLLLSPIVKPFGTSPGFFHLAFLKHANTRLTRRTQRGQSASVGGSTLESFVGAWAERDR